MIQATFELRTRQQLTLTPRLQQSVKLLQMSSLDFNREVAQALSENPFLEDGDEENASTAAEGRQQPSAGNDPVPDIVPPSDAAPDASAAPEGEISPERYDSEPREYGGDYPNAPHGADTDISQWAHTSAPWRDTLRSDMLSYRLTPRDRLLVEFVIDALDDDGYLRSPLTELAETHQFDPPVQCEEWDIALKLVQQAAPPGVGARSLVECIQLQLAALPSSTTGLELALKLAAEHLERVAHREHPWLAKHYKCREEDIWIASELIRSLDPKPGRQLSQVDPSNYVIPDVFVRRQGDVWVAIPNEAAVPKARLHMTYARLFKQSVCADRSPMAQALQEARWLLRSIEQRCTTIHRVAQAIVARQQTFFEYGEIALRPLMLSTIAEELGVHESTISRATSQKYLATARGIYEFKHFFSRELTTHSGGTCSSAAVRALIKEMIEAENPREPLSDVILTKKLAREGIVVARRTVSKYRAQLKTPSAEMRRVL